MPQPFNLLHLVNESGCFDLQFRKDVRHERTGSPTYYRWKLEFVITAAKENAAVLEMAQKELGCGNVSIIKEQARFSVQNIDDINSIVVPYFTRHSLGGGGHKGNPPSRNASADKEKDFDLWQKAAAIAYKNKGKAIAKWEKSDLTELIQIHQQMAKFKARPRKQKWIDMAQTFAKQPNK